VKLRLDKLILDRGLAPSRERAQAMVIAGRVLVNGQKVEKSGAAVAHDAEIRILGDDPLYVSRGGLKLEHALKHWEIDVIGKLCADIGTSTGGFTDCLLQHGAGLVICVDTGRGQIADKLRRDSRVKLLEGTNARNLIYNAFEIFTPNGRLHFISMDVSFISATLVLPAVITAAFGEEGQRRGELVVLIKPQFEAGREYIGKGGIVRDEIAWQASVQKVAECVRDLGGKSLRTMESPIKGAEGNVEYLLHAVWKP